MLKIVYHVCCGMDVHKSFIVACIASTKGDRPLAHREVSVDEAIFILQRQGYLVTALPIA